MTPRDVVTIATPRPFMTCGMLLLPLYTRSAADGTFTFRALLARGSATLVVREPSNYQRYEAAIELLEREGLKRFPFEAEVVMTLARLELSRGNTKACREALKKLPPGIDVSTRVRALGMEASAAERDGQASKALGFMRTALALRPDDTGLRWRYANLLERIGRLELAVREAEAAAAKSPGLQVELDRLRKRVEAKKLKLEEQKRWQQLGLDGAPK